MGRSLAGNSVAAAVTTLARSLGNLSSTVKDPNTTSGYEATAVGGYFAINYTSLGSFQRNSVAEQVINTNYQGVLQDELSDYTYIQSWGYYAGSYSGIVGVVYDADLNAIYTWGSGSGATPPYPGNLFCIRLYNSNLYFFSSQSSGIVCTKVALPSGTVTQYAYTTGMNGNWSNASGNSRVFNWPISGKFYVYSSQGNGGSGYYDAKVLTFDTATNTWTTFSTFSGTASAYVNSSHFAMHVKADASAVSVAAYNAADGNYGVLLFTASTGSFNPISTSGHWYASYTGGYYVFCASNALRCAVTTDCVIDYTTVNYAPGSTYYNQFASLQGGDTSCPVNTFSGPSGSYIYPVQNLQPSYALTIRDQAMLTLNNSSGTYQVARSGSSVVFTKRSSVYVNQGNFGAVASKLPDQTIAVQMAPDTIQGASNMYLANVYIRTTTGTLGYSFSVFDGTTNSYGYNYLDSPVPLSFVTSKGRFFSMASYNSQSNRTYAQAVKGYLPVFLPTVNKTYNVTVIGGGGATSGTNGDSSTFGSLAAANGLNRTGYVAGSTVLTSGPTRGTGGTGYGSDGWGQGEDTATAGAYGGGSGYVTFGTISVTANGVYPYKAGLGPQYGKQGAILLSEV